MEYFNLCFSFFLYMVIANLLSITYSTRVKRGNGPREIPLIPSQVEEILHKHNTLRASVSSSNMRYMTWDSELERIARDYGTKCQFSHNKQGLHSKFKNSVGENIYVARSPVELFQASAAIQLWFDEKEDFTYSTLTCQPNKKCGHYTQIVWANTYKIGCSLTMCDYVSDFDQPDSHLFICNYAPAGNVYTVGAGNVRTMQKPFIKGRACSKCLTSTDTCRDGLCANPARDANTEPLQPKDGELNPVGGSPHTRSDNRGGGDDGNCDTSGLVVAVVLLSLLVLILLAYTIYRDRVKLTLQLRGWSQGQKSTNHSKFSNQNTPQPSRCNTPRQSIVGISLHGDVNGRLTVHPPIVASKPSPVKPMRPKSRDIQRLHEKGSHSAPNSPLRPMRPPRPIGAI